MPRYEPTKVEPAGKDQCSECRVMTHLWSDEYEDGEYVDPLCVECLSEVRPEFPQALLEDTMDYEVMGEMVVLDFGYSLVVEFPFTEEEVAASRNPNETRTVIQPSVDRTGVIRHHGKDIGTFKSSSWRKYAEKKVRDHYVDRRGRR